MRKYHGTIWSIEGQLLASVIDALHVGNWQRGGRKSAPKPKPIKRPWEKPKGRTIGKDPIPIAKFNEWWDTKRDVAAARKKRRRTKKPPTA